MWLTDIFDRLFPPPPLDVHPEEMRKKREQHQKNPKKFLKEYDKIRKSTKKNNQTNHGNRRRK